MQIKYISCRSANRPSLLQKAVMLAGTVALAGVALMFSALLLLFLLVAGSMAWAFLWWKTRELRRQMKNFSPRYTDMEREVFRGEVIEGEAVRVDAKRDAPTGKRRMG